MKLLSFFCNRKKEDKTAIMTATEVDGEPAAKDDNATLENGMTMKELKRLFSAAMGISALILFAILFSMLLLSSSVCFRGDPTPKRIVFLNRSDAGYGLSFDGDFKITNIIPDSTADLDGRLKIGDNIRSIHVVVGSTRSEADSSFANFRDFLGASEDGVEFVAGEKYEEPISVRLPYAFAISLAFSVIPFGLFTLCALLGARAPSYRTVTLTKTTGEQYGFTFEHHFIKEVSPGSPADMQELKKGDLIIKVNGVRISGLYEHVVQEILNTRDNEVILVVRCRDCK